MITVGSTGGEQAYGNIIPILIPIPLPLICATHINTHHINT